VTLVAALDLTAEQASWRGTVKRRRTRVHVDSGW